MQKYDNKCIKCIWCCYSGFFCDILFLNVKMYLWLKLYTVPFFVSGQTYKISKGSNNYCSYCMYLFSLNVWVKWSTQHSGLKASNPAAGSINLMHVLSHNDPAVWLKFSCFLTQHFFQRRQFFLKGHLETTKGHTETKWYYGWRVKYHILLTKVDNTFCLPFPLSCYPPLSLPLLELSSDSNRLRRLQKHTYNNHNNNILYTNILIEVHWFKFFLLFVSDLIFISFPHFLSIFNYPY